jgi:thiol-disulfide isomerase/thioredoxin
VHALKPSNAWADPDSRQESNMPHLIRRPLRSALGILAISMACFAALATPCQAGELKEAGQDSPATGPATRPAVIIQQDEASPDGGLLHVVTPATHPSLTATTGPSTQPATQPAVAIAPEAQPELDAIRDAYKGLNTLHVAGTISADLDMNGQQRTPHGTFQGDFQAQAGGAPRFRQTTHDAAARSPAAADHIVGSTGEKLYFFDPFMQEMQTAEAPKTKFQAGKMPEPYYEQLILQDPSLLLAVVADAEAEILDGLVSVKKIDDVKIDDDSYPTLQFLDKGGDITDFMIDPRTHLLRRAVSDQRESYKKQGQSDVNKVLITIDYTEVSPGADVKEDQFAFKPPEGAREVIAAADAGPQLQAAGGGAAANSLEGKPAPDFKLKGMDDKEVALSGFRGSVIVLDFWATWCGPCRAALPHLNKLYEQKKGDGLKVFALDQKEDKDDVQQGITELKLTIPVLLDAEGKVGEKYLVSGIPQTVVIGKDGKVKKVIVGFGGSDAELRKAVDEAMK